MSLWLVCYGKRQMLNITVLSILLLNVTIVSVVMLNVFILNVTVLCPYAECRYS
jgi:hypothetical protein